MLRPLPHRGDVVAAGAVALAALVALLQVRFDDAWGKGIHFAYAAAALAFVGTLALRAPREGDAPRAYQSALLAVTFALAVPTLARLSLLLGSDGLDSSGTLAWAGGALAALGFGLGVARGLGALRAARRGEPRPRRPGLRRPGLLARRRADLPLAPARARRRSRRRDRGQPRPPSGARRRLRRRGRAGRAGPGLDPRGGSGLRFLAALRPRRGHRLGALPLRVRLRAVRVLGGGPCAGPGVDRRRRSCWPRRWPPPAARRRCSAGRSCWPSAPAGCSPSVCDRAGRCRPRPRAARPMSSRSGASSERPQAGAGPRPGRRPRAPSRQGARAGQAARARARRAAARRRARSSRRRCWPTGRATAWAPTASSPAWAASPGGRWR